MNTNFLAKLTLNMGNISTPEEPTPPELKMIFESCQDAVKHALEDTGIVMNAKLQKWLSTQIFKKMKINSTQFISDVIVVNEFERSDFEQNELEALESLVGHTNLFDTLRK